MSRTKQHLVTTPVPMLAAALLAGFALTGCSLLTIKSPEIPLTPREQEARLLTRDYAAHFATTISHLIDDAARENTDPAIRLQALRLKLGAVTEVTRASTGLSPMGSLLDTWAFSLQFRDFLTTGSGANLLGSAQPEVSRGAAVLGDEADALARKVWGGDYSRYRTFVSGYAERNPLQNADMVRPSVLAAWMLEESDKNPLRADGTVAQALGDVSDRMRIYSERVPAMSLWQAELALNRAGFDDASYRTALHNMDAQLERISKLADTSPELAHEAIGELRRSLRESSDRLDTSWMQMLRTLRTEREALAANIAAERQGLTEAFDAERVRISADAAKVAAEAVDTSWRELRKLVREALLLTILLAVVVLGLPFTAGYWVGRRRDAPARG
ncbi:MAG TPA: hypothetical protein VNV61_11310 [Steroidobacteraceae bacterium]|jgi:hypothetical protein|nr:hypothetical protein [Steroidobacteraceae bacterium]